MTGTPSVLAEDRAPAAAAVLLFMQRIPILSYRGFVADAERATSAILSEGSFRRQMDFLKDAGAAGCSLEALMEGTRRAAPERGVVLTFDGADISHYHFVLPLLKEKGFTATFFVAIADIGKPGKMEWPMLYELVKSRMGVGPLGVVPQGLEFSNDYVLLNDLLTAKQALEKYTRKRVDFLAASQGVVNRRLFAIASDIGFKGIGLADAGYNDFSRDGFLLLRRFTARRHHSIKTFASIVGGRPPAWVVCEEALRGLGRRCLGLLFVKSR